MSPRFKPTLVHEAADGSLRLEPSPYIHGCALVTPVGDRALRLTRSMGARSCGDSQFHLTTGRAHKLHTLFVAGFDAREDGSDSYLYVRGAARPMRLYEALNTCRAMEVAP